MLKISLVKEILRNLETQFVAKVEAQIIREREYLLGLPFRIRKPKPSKYLSDLAKNLGNSYALKQHRILFFKLKRPFP